MNRPYRLVVFDWEGTLGDTLGQVLNAVATAAQHLHLGEVDERVARQYIGLGLPIAVQKIFPSLSTHEYQQLLQEIEQSITTHSGNIYLFPGAKQLVEHLHQEGMELAIATNKGQISLQRALHASGLEAFFNVTRCASQVPAKPCPQMIEEIIDESGVPRSQTLMVGDSVSDMEMAEQAGVDAVGVDFYHQQEASLREAGALEVFDDYQQLAKYLNLR